MNDKLKHAIAGDITMIVSFLALFFLKFKDPIIGALFIRFFVGMLKEMYDEMKYGGFDYKDLFATMMPSIVVYLIIKYKK